jgi:hypothetical protein
MSMRHSVNQVMTHLIIDIKRTNDLILLISNFHCLQYLNVEISELNTPTIDW